MNELASPPAMMWHMGQSLRIVARFSHISLIWDSFFSFLEERCRLKMMKLSTAIIAVLSFQMISLRSFSGRLAIISSTLCTFVNLFFLRMMAELPWMDAVTMNNYLLIFDSRSSVASCTRKMSTSSCSIAFRVLFIFSSSFRNDLPKNFLIKSVYFFGFSLVALSQLFTPYKCMIMALQHIRSKFSQLSCSSFVGGVFMTLLFSSNYFLQICRNVASSISWPSTNPASARQRGEYLSFWRSLSILPNPHLKSFESPLMESASRTLKQLLRLDSSFMRSSEQNSKGDNRMPEQFTEVNASSFLLATTPIFMQTYIAHHQLGSYIKEKNTLAFFLQERLIISNLDNTHLNPLASLSYNPKICCDPRRHESYYLQLMAIFIYCTCRVFYSTLPR